MTDTDTNTPANDFPNGNVGTDSSEDGTPPSADTKDPLAQGPFPTLDPETVLEEFKKRCASSLAHSKDWRNEAKEMFDFQAGRQWDVDDEARMKDQNRPMVTFNLMSKFIDVVTGLQINNRQTIRCYPRQNGKLAVSEMASGAIDWCRDKSGAEYEETDAGNDCLLTGMGWIETSYDEESDPDGIVVQERRDPLEMLWDPMARKKNLTDRRWQVRLKRVTYDEYVDLFDKEPTSSVAIVGMDPGDLDAGLQIINKPQDYNGEAVPSQTRGQYMVADYQFMQLHTVWNVTANYPGQGPKTAQFSDDEWRGDDEGSGGAKAALQSQGIPHQAEKIKVRCFYRCWVTGEGIHNDKINRLNVDGFTFHAITGKRDRNKNLWFGLGRNLKDPQRWVNAFFSSIIWQLMVNPKGGIMVEESAASDQGEFENTYSDPSKVTWVEDGAITGGKLQPKPSGTYPEGMDRLMNFSMQALPGVTGINAELLGLQTNDQAGVTEYQRKQGALAIIAWYFDAMRRYYQEAGHVMLSIIRDFMADGRLIRIVGDEGAQYVPLIRDPLVAKFDIIVDEAPTSVNMRERVFAALKEMIPMALQAGIMPPKDVLDYAPLPDDLIQKWKQSLQPDPQALKEQAMAKQIAQKAAITKITKDQAQADQASATAQLKQTEAQIGVFKAPQDLALQHAETIRKAAEAGQMQAGVIPS